MDVKKHVEKAEEAVRKKNFPYALQLLHQVITVKPDHGEAYALLCRAVQAQAERKSTGGALAKLVGSPFLLSSGVGKLSKNPAGRARALLKYLKLEAKNPAIYLSLGEALAQAGHHRAAVAVLESGGELDPKQSDCWRVAAQCHQALGQIEQGLECLERAIQANPRDAEAERMRKNLSADLTLRGGSYDRAEHSRQLMRDRDQQEKLEREQRLHQSEDEIETEIEDLRAAVEDGGDGRQRRRLAELLGKRGRLDEALACLEGGVGQGDDNEADLLDRVGDLRIAVVEREVRKLEKRVAEDDRAELREDLEDLRGALLETQSTEFERRVEARPTDLGLWYALGKILQKKGDVEAAIGAFQKSVKDPRSRVDSLIRLGACFHKKGLLDLAEKQLLAALEESPVSSDRGKSILYNLGLIAERAGRPVDARAHYARIYEQDIGYRDVAKKIEALSSE